MHLAGTIYDLTDHGWVRRNDGAEQLCFAALKVKPLHEVFAQETAAGDRPTFAELVEAAKSRGFAENKDVAAGLGIMAANLANYVKGDNAPDELRQRLAALTKE